MRLLVCFVISMAVFAQQAVDPRNLYERLLCIVPIIGEGTYEDPKRPLFTPKPGERSEGGPATEIIAFSWVPSDDGKRALVEFVARDREAFAPILSNRRPDVVRFEKGRSTREEVEQEFRKHKKDFNLSQFGATVR